MPLGAFDLTRLQHLISRDVMSPSLDGSPDGNQLPRHGLVGQLACGDPGLHLQSPFSFPQGRLG